MQAVNLIISYTIQSEEYLEYTLELIADFLNQIEKNEPDTLMYKSFQSVENPKRFFHVMSFADESAQSIHRNSSYCQEFASKLYPICIEEPTVVNLDELENYPH